MADISNLLNQYLQNQNLGLYQSLQSSGSGLAAVLGRQALARKQAEQELINQIRLAQETAKAEQQYQSVDPLKKAQADFLNKILGKFGGQQPTISEKPIISPGEFGKIPISGINEKPQEYPTMEEFDVGGFKFKLKPSLQEQKFAQEKIDKKLLQDKQSELIKTSATDILNTISEIKKSPYYFGLMGGLPSIPGTSRVNWDSNVKKLLSGKVLEVMNTMKQASKTGATGFGSLSNKELDVLFNAATAFKPTLPEKDAIRYLNQMETVLQKVVEGDSKNELQSINDEIRRIDELLNR